MSSTKQFHIGDIGKRCWYDSTTDTYTPYSEMSKEELQKYLHIAQKKELKLIQKQNVFIKIIENIDTECNNRGFTIKDIEATYYKNTRALQSKVEVKNI